MPRVIFANVGEAKTTWEETLTNVDEASLVRAIQQKQALRSTEMAVSDGIIWVGGRPVGQVEVVAEPERGSLANT